MCSSNVLNIHQMFNDKILIDLMPWTFHKIFLGDLGRPLWLLVVAYFNALMNLHKNLLSSHRCQIYFRSKGPWNNTVYLNLFWTLRTLQLLTFILIKWFSYSTIALKRTLSTDQRNHWTILLITLILIWTPL